MLIVCAILFGSFAAGVIALVKSSGAYKGALVRAQESDAVQAEIGEGIEDGWWVLGNVQTSNRGGNADLRFPVQGSRNKAVVHVLATKANGDWIYHSLIVVPRNTGQSIDLTKEAQNDSRNGASGSP